MKLADANYFTAFCALQNENNDGEVLIERFIAEANKQDQAYLSPEPGQLVSSGEEKSSEWWKKYM